MPINYKDYPPNWKTEIRPAILKRANNCCEFCGVKNYSVGYHYNEGGIRGFWVTAGNEMHDKAGRGELPYKQALEMVKHCRECCDDKPVIIVLTVAHLDHNTSNNDPANLAALCQRCHLRYDREHHAETRRKTNERKKGLMSMF